MLELLDDAELSLYSDELTEFLFAELVPVLISYPLADAILSCIALYTMIILDVICRQKDINIAIKINFITRFIIFAIPHIIVVNYIVLRCMFLFNTTKHNCNYLLLAVLILL